ncbi:MAG: response regulator transcription factor [Candidatus Sericytochromatia bacterium]|nr:response regulator transcription factor [Candidatus Sericytochromatia bacterium]
MKPHTVLLADDHPLFRAGLRLVLEGLGGLKITAEATDGEEAVEKAGLLSPDLVIMDVTMPLMGGLEACARIVRTRPEAIVIILTPLEEPMLASRAKAAGAKAVMRKSEAGEALVDWVKAFRDRPLRLPPGHGLPSDDPHGEHLDLIATLTPREREVLALLAAGHTNREIADQLAIGLRTVETHRARLQDKLGLQGRASLQAWARSTGLGR